MISIAPHCTYRCAVLRRVIDARDLCFWMPPRHGMTIVGIDWDQPADPVADLLAAFERIEAESRAPLEPTRITDKQAAWLRELSERISAGGKPWGS